MFINYIEILKWKQIAENNLSFIETSALDSSNVELAFTKILTGKRKNN